MRRFIPLLAGCLSAVIVVFTVYANSSWRLPANMCGVARTCVTKRIQDLNTNGGGDVVDSPAQTVAAARAAVLIHTGNNSDVNCLYQSSNPFPTPVFCAEQSGSRKWELRNVLASENGRREGELWYKPASSWFRVVNVVWYLPTLNFEVKGICTTSTQAVRFQGGAHSQDPVQVCWGN